MNATSEAIRKVKLPGSVAFRHELYQNGVTNDAYKRQSRGMHEEAADLSQLLAEIRRQLSIKRIRLKEFLVEGDKLRSGEITVAKFHTALNRSGYKIDWRTFLEAIDLSHGVNIINDQVCQDSMEDSVKNILERLRAEIIRRRLHLKPYFKDYDPNNVKHVTQFQFAAVLDMMQMSLKPAEIKILMHHFNHRDGRKSTNDINYLAFVHAVESDYSKTPM
ncbi:putative EF-hand domain pair protein [Plasmopara halstedii]